MNIGPLHDRAALKRDERQRPSHGGILIPDTAGEKPTQARVVAVGQGNVLDNGKTRPMDLKVGDRVQFGKHSGTEVKVGSRSPGQESVTGGNRMAKLAIKHWEDPVNLALGLWLLVSPWVLKFAAERSLMWSMAGLGGLIIVVAGAALYSVAAWQRVASIVLGLCAIVDPWISETGHADANATLNSVTVGWVLVALAVWTFANDQDISELGEGRPPNSR